MASLIDAATALARANPTRPAQPFLRRAVSTAYYAVFQVFAGECADLFVGGGATRAGSEWVRVFRALDHGAAKSACTQLANVRITAGMVYFVTVFLALQEERHRADYDPASRYARQEALDLIERAENAIGYFRAAPRADRRALAVLAMFKKR